MTDAILRARSISYTTVVNVLARVVGEEGDTTFNPSDQGGAPGITFSNGNLTVTAGGGTNFGMTRSTTSRTSGKWHFEFYWDFDPRDNEPPDPATSAVGIANALQSITFNYLGDDIHSIGMFDNGQVYYDFAFTGVDITPEPATGLWSIIEVDLDAKLIWFCTENDTTWNDPNNGDPALGTGGMDISTIIDNGPVFIAADMGHGSIVTLNAGATPFFRTPSSGFSAWQS